ncbi:MAG: glutamate--tRNA ligase [Clostridiales bacterium]|nr:glutamate--tRNA ligase [Clostridiales bacterium]
MTISGNDIRMAKLLFPNITATPEHYEGLFPQRGLTAGAKVTRLAPSPTGFIHLGNLYGAFVDERLAHQSEGVFFLRIEDTDEKRYVDGAVDVIISSLKFFGIDFDEGAGPDGDTGDYGPYHQSNRTDVYQCFAKHLVERGCAYPCFLTEQEISEIRQAQEKRKENPGIYGEWASGRDLTFEQVESRVRSGMPYVLRLKSAGAGGTIHVEDGIRGTLAMPENNQDVVLLKTNGVPTYHFAHVVDDHLMRTTHVVRGAEWLPSLPIHIELFKMLGFPLPVYCHTAQLMKLGEGGNKRKLSKREDPELSLDYYRNEGYHPNAVREYLLTILNSDYEEWRRANPGKDAGEFPFAIEKMSTSGALFDLDKLNDVSKDVLLGIPAEELCGFMAGWAKEFRPEIAGLFEGNETYVGRILDLGRSGSNPRKDLICAKQIFEFIRYFFDSYFTAVDEPPPNVSKADASAILKSYLDTYCHGDDQQQWFGKIREIGASLGYAAKPKDFKKNPDQYKGHVGDVSTVIRIALVGRAQSPDLWEIQQILGEERVRQRIKNCVPA